MKGRAIWKMDLSSEPVQQVWMRGAADVIHAEVQDGIPRIWFVCQPDEPRLKRTFLLLPTGGPFGEFEGQSEGWTSAVNSTTHISTFFSEDRTLIGHLFEILLPEAEFESLKKQVEHDLAMAGKPGKGGGWR